MTLTEQFANNENMKQKANAWDQMQRQRELANEYNRGNGDAYAAGRRDSAAELNALMREGLAQQMVDPRMYSAPDITAGITEGTPSIQGTPIGRPAPDLRYTNETSTPAPVQGLAQRMAR